MYIFPYKPSWKDEFELISQSLLDAAVSEITLHHIGSTSVPDLCAKDCIDVLGIVNDFESGLALVKPFTNLGYRYRGENGIAKRHYFSKDGKPKVHLQVLPLGHEQIDVHLHFKNTMCKDPDLVKELNDLKTEMSVLFPKEIYQIKKKAFYDKVHRLKL